MADDDVSPSALGRGTETVTLGIEVREVRARPESLDELRAYYANDPEGRWEISHERGQLMTRLKALYGSDFRARLEGSDKYRLLADETRALRDQGAAADEIQRHLFDRGGELRAPAAASLLLAQHDLGRGGDEEPPQVGRHVEVRLLVDGDDVISRIWDGDWLDPDELIGVSSPLTPGPRPREVALLQCGCGLVECGALMVRIRREGDVVTWDGFRDAVGLDYEEGRPHPGEFRFAADQYLAELERAHRERDWEWPERTCARRVGEILAGRRSELSARGLELTWAQAGSEDPASYDKHRFTSGTWSSAGVSVSLIQGDRQYVLGFPGAVDDPEVRAREICEQILATSSTEWPVTLATPVLRSE